VLFAANGTARQRQVGELDEDDLASWQKQIQER
jgi:hypothetical protein